jgi:hypothetical protein
VNHGPRTLGITVSFSEVLLAELLLNPDPENAPLLNNGGHDGDQDPPDPRSPRRSLTGRLTDVVQEPLTGLTKVLLVEVLILLLISSVFIGLFAGAQHRLNLRNGRGGGGGGGGGGGDDEGNGTQTETETQTVTFTTTAATTVVSATTTTAVSTALSTIFDITTTTETSIKTSTTTAVYTSVSTYTTTDHTTRTVIVGPEPTGPPDPPQPGPSKVRSVALIHTSCLLTPCAIRKYASPRNASFSPHRSWLHWIPLKIHARTSTIFPVSKPRVYQRALCAKRTIRRRLDSLTPYSWRQGCH